VARADPDTAADGLHKMVHLARHALEPALRSGNDSRYLQRAEGQLRLVPPTGIRIDADDFAATATRERHQLVPPARTNLAVIQIHLEGGLSHLDTFDPKPDAPIEVRGPFGTVQSKLAGEPHRRVLGRPVRRRPERQRGRRGRGTKAHNRSSRTCGSSTTAVVPSFQRFLSL
jgi:hypothetical protein